MRFWRTSHPRDIRKENITLHEWSPCREPTDERHRWRYRRGDEQLFTWSTSTLWPFSEITAGIVVLNGAKEGDISNTVTFNTLQGGNIIEYLCCFFVDLCMYFVLRFIHSCQEMCLESKSYLLVNYMQKMCS